MIYIGVPCDPHPISERGFTADGYESIMHLADAGKLVAIDTNDPNCLKDTLVSAGWIKEGDASELAYDVAGSNISVFRDSKPFTILSITHKIES